MDGGQVRQQTQWVNSGFVTVNHGDVHPGNILNPNGTYHLLDQEYMHIGLNLLDLGYIDYFGECGDLRMNRECCKEYPHILHNE